MTDTDLLLQMATFYLSEPILWIKSSVWFKFQARRVDELQRAQIRLFHLNPSNMGIITGVFCHLMRCVETTPLIVPNHVRDSLALLNLRENQVRFGLFFLHDLALGTSEPLPQVEEKDTLDVLAALGHGAKKAQKPAPIEDQGPSVAYPLGTHPTWVEVKKCLKENPWTLITEWQYNALWAGHDAATRLFLSFTNQVWCLLNDNLKSERFADVQTLEKAMEFWSLRSLHFNLTKMTVVASNSGLLGAAGGVNHGFRHLGLTVFFPKPDVAQHRGSQWKEFYSSVGYIKAYHDKLEELNEMEQQQLTSHLGEYFAHVQGLPHANPGRQRGNGYVWVRKDEGVAIVTNSHFYKLEGLSPHRRPRAGDRPRRVSAVNPKMIFLRNLMNTEMYHEDAARQVVQAERRHKQMANTQRTQQAKNKRVPPTKSGGQTGARTETGTNESSGMQFNTVMNIHRRGAVVAGKKRKRTEKSESESDEESESEEESEEMPRTPRRSAMKKGGRSRKVVLGSGGRRIIESSDSEIQVLGSSDSEAGMSTNDRSGGRTKVRFAREEAEKTDSEVSTSGDEEEKDKSEVEEDDKMDDAEEVSDSELDYEDDEGSVEL